MYKYKLLITFSQGKILDIDKSNVYVYLVKRKYSLTGLKRVYLLGCYEYLKKNNTKLYRFSKAVQS